MEPWFDGYYTIKNGENAEFDNGKVFYPNGIHIYVDRRKALQIIQELAVQVEDECGEISFLIVGKLEKEEE